MAAALVTWSQHGQEDQEMTTRKVVLVQLGGGGPHCCLAAFLRTLTDGWRP
jgi:hypothetical protein